MPVGVNLISRRQSVIFYDDPEKPFVHGQIVAIGEDGRIRHPKNGDMHCFRLNIIRKEMKIGALTEVHACVPNVVVFPYRKPEKPIRVRQKYGHKRVSMYWIYIAGKPFRPDFMPKGVYTISEWDIARAMTEACGTLKLMDQTKWVSTPDNRPRHG